MLREKINMFHLISKKGKKFKLIFSFKKYKIKKFFVIL